MITTSKLAAAFGVAVALATSPAGAQTFTGPRVEALVGLDQLRYDLATAAGTTTQKGSDLGYRVEAGYDRAVTPAIVIGIEGGVGFSQGDYTTAGFPGGDTVHVRRDLSAAVRIGTRIGNNALLYGKVGYSDLQLGTDTVAQGAFDPTAGTGTAVAATSTYGRRDYDGVLVGAGVEVGLTHNTYLKSEYRYTNYEAGVSRQNVLTGIGLHF